MEHVYGTSLLRVIIKHIENKKWKKNTTKTSYFVKFHDTKKSMKNYNEHLIQITL